MKVFLLRRVAEILYRNQMSAQVCIVTDNALHIAEFWSEITVFFRLAEICSVGTA